MAESQPGLIRKYLKSRQNASALANMQNKREQKA